MPRRENVMMIANRLENVNFAVGMRIPALQFPGFAIQENTTTAVGYVAIGDGLYIKVTIPKADEIIYQESSAGVAAEAAASSIVPIIKQELEKYKKTVTHACL